MKKLFLIYLLSGFVIGAAAQTNSAPPMAPPAGDSIVTETAEPPQIVQHTPTYAETDTTIFQFAEIMPKFPGGDSAWNGYLNRNLHYPPAEKDQGITGTVYVSFIVEKDGSVTYPKIARSVSNGPGFNREVLRLITASPKWKPGTLNGKNIRVQLMVPVQFSLPLSPH